MADFERILYAVDKGVAVVTLNRPEKRNALDVATVAELQEALDRVGRDGDGNGDDFDEGVRVVLLRGAGPDFCAGADLAELESVAAGSGPLENLDDASELGELLIQMRRLPVPIVAAVHGNAIAGGAGLATACDLVIAADDAEFGYPEVHLGFVPAMVMALLRRATGEKVAFELVTRGERIGAREARRVGLVNEVMSPDGFEDLALDYARDLASRSPSALRLCKRLLYGIDQTPFEEAVRRGAEVNVLARMTPDTREGVRRFLSKKKS